MKTKVCIALAVIVMTGCGAGTITDRQITAAGDLCQEHGGVKFINAPSLGMNRMEVHCYDGTQMDNVFIPGYINPYRN